MPDLRPRLQHRRSVTGIRVVAGKCLGAGDSVVEGRIQKEHLCCRGSDSPAHPLLLRCTTRADLVPPIDSRAGQSQGSRPGKSENQPCRRAWRPGDRTRSSGRACTATSSVPLLAIAGCPAPCEWTVVADRPLMGCVQQHKAHEKPAIFWSFLLGLAGPSPLRGPSLSRCRS